MKKQLKEEVLRIKKMMKKLNEHEFDFDAPYNDFETYKVGDVGSHMGITVKIVKIYNTIGALKKDQMHLDSLNNGLSGAALALINEMDKEDKLPIFLIKDADNEYDLCFSSELENVNNSNI